MIIAVFLSYVFVLCSVILLALSIVEGGVKLRAIRLAYSVVLAVVVTALAYIIGGM